MVNAEDIEEVKVCIYPNAIKLAGIKYPKDQDETKFSIQYTLACALLNGSYGIEDMNSLRMTDDMIRLIEKIKLIPDEAMENREKGIRGTRVEVVLKNGETIVRTVFVPKGDPENPLLRDDIIDKLRICAKGQAVESKLVELVNEITKIKGDKVFNNPMALL